MKSRVVCLTPTQLGLRGLASFIFLVIPRILQGWPVRRQLISSFVYSRDCYVSPLEARYLTPPTGQAIRDYCHNSGITHVAKEFDCGSDAPRATLHYLNSKPEEIGNVVLFFHGGGFGNPLVAAAYVPFNLDFARNASISKVVCLEYTLAPGLRYPGQLVQALYAMRHLLEVHKPSEIVIGGDSAGGNLSLAILAHIIKPSPYAPTLQLGGDKAEKLRGAFMISPWVTFDVSSPSFRKNAGTDIIGKHVLNQYVVNLKPKRGEVYAEPLVAEPAFWSNLPAKNVIITAGAWEVFQDHIETLAKKMGAEAAGGSGPVELAVAAKEQHDQCLFDHASGLPPTGHMARSVSDWARRI